MSKTAQRFANVSKAGMHRPDKYCPTVGCFMPNLSASSLCVIPLVFMASVSRARIFSIVIIPKSLL